MDRRSLLLRLCLVSLAWSSSAAAPRAEEERAKELQALVAELAGSAGPGGLLAVLRRGEPTFVATFGLADVEEERPITPETVFYLASVSKAFTGACVLHAAEAKKLALDDTLATRVSGGPAAWKTVHLCDLLAHRGGVTDVYDLAIGLDLGAERVATNASALELLRRLPGLDGEPGTRTCYSNSGYLLLAEALGGATGQDLRDYARAAIFEPLGMQSAGFAGDPRQAELPRAHGYRQSAGAWQRFEHEIDLQGPGGMWASLEDLTRWERALALGRWGSEALRREYSHAPALAPQATLHPAFGDYWAGQMFGADRGLAVVRMAGEAFGFQAELLRYPEQEVSIIVLANADLGLDNLAEDAAGVVLREELHPSPEPVASAAFDPKRVGRFWREEGSGIIWVLTPREGYAVLASLGDWKVEIVPTSAERAVSRGARAPVEVRFEPAGAPATRMIVSVDGRELVACRPQAFAPADPAGLEECAGEYELAALGATITLRAVPGGLELVQQHPLTPEFVLPPFRSMGDDLFACDAGAQLTFLRDESGAVVGLRMDANRARGLVLEKRGAAEGDGG